MQGWIPGPQDHDLGQRQTLNWLSHPGAPTVHLLLFSGSHTLYTKLWKLYCWSVLATFPGLNCNRKFSGVSFSRISELVLKMHLNILSPLFFFFKDFIHLFDRDRDSQREREHKQGEWERKKQARSGGAWCGARSQNGQDHALSRRQTLNDCATQAPPEAKAFFLVFFFKDFIWHRETASERGNTSRESGREEEAGS